MAASDRPTAKQLRYRRALAEQTGTTFTTKREANEAIDQLRHRAAEPPGERRRQRREVSDDLARPDSASSVRRDEMAGYGPTPTGADGGLRVRRR
jgi:hypothetical protein